MVLEFCLSADVIQMRVMLGQSRGHTLIMPAHQSSAFRRTFVKKKISILS